MDQAQRRAYLIDALLREQPRYRGVGVPGDEGEQRRLLRSLMNVRPAAPIGEDFLRVQDEYLQEELARKGITDIRDLDPVEEGLYLWRGDITTLRCDAIVNAANSGLTGCYVPCHACIDNCIHTFAGVQLRLDCARLMQEQGRPEPTGRARITPAYDLPCRYVLHTVGPIISGPVTARDKQLLADCYRSCLDLAAEKGLESVAFCCISTGEFHFPRPLAGRIAVDTVRAWRRRHHSEMKVIFNVFGEANTAVYRELFGLDR